jgi:uncharacterized protein GlcG (DUF336 family)
LVAAAVVVPNVAGYGGEAVSGEALSAADVQIIIAQAAGKAQELDFAATIAVTDREGNVLGTFAMNGARSDVVIGSTDGVIDVDALDGTTLPLGAAAAAVSKAGTAAYLSSDGNAFTTRTANFIVQENIPPGITSQPGGDLFGVQFSQLPCSDVTRNPLPLGLSADPGGVPIYKNGALVGGIGVEGDGSYGIDSSIQDQENLPEELIAAAAAWGFVSPPAVRADQISIDGMTLPYGTVAEAAPQLASLAEGAMLLAPKAPPASQFGVTVVEGIPVKFDSRFFPPKAGSGLTAVDVARVLTQALQQAARTGSAIRVPASSPIEVNFTVVDVNGAILGSFSTQDAPDFGFDVSAQKARTAAFFSRHDAGARLRAAGQGAYVDAATAAGVPLDGTVAFSSRAIGALSNDGAPFGPPDGFTGPLNTGLQLALGRSALLDGANGAAVSDCTSVPGLNNGMQIHGGGVPIYKDGALVGAIGISGDGIEEDEFVASAGIAGFEAPSTMTSDNLRVNGVLLPYLRFPDQPNL